MSSRIRLFFIFKKSTGTFKNKKEEKKTKEIFITKQH